MVILTFRLHILCVLPFYFKCSLFCTYFIRRTKLQRLVVFICGGEALWAVCYHVWHSTNAWQVACICVGLARVGLARVGVARKPHVTHLNHTYTPSNLSQRVTQRQRQQGRHSDTRGRDSQTDTRRIAARRNVVHVAVLTEPLTALCYLSSLITRR